MNNPKLILPVVFAVLVLVGAFVLLKKPKDTTNSTTDIAELEIVPVIVEEPAPPIEEPVEPELEDYAFVEEVVLPLAPEIILPPSDLNKSDGAVVSAGRDISEALAIILTPAEQIRKWVVFVDSAADGELMSAHRPFAIDIGKFKTFGEDGDETLSKQNFDRYKSLIDLVTAIPVEKMAYYLKRWDSLFQEAYKELGKSGNFEQRLLMAFDQVLITTPLKSLPDLSRTSVMYKYTDVRLESATGIQKLMWRIGPDNMARLQLYIQSLRDTYIDDIEYQQDELIGGN